MKDSGKKERIEEEEREDLEPRMEQISEVRLFLGTVAARAGLDPDDIWNELETLLLTKQVKIKPLSS